MELNEVFERRYSAKNYKSTPVEQEKIDEILSCINTAPTAKNMQAFRVYVIQSKENLDKVRSLTPCHYNAPVILLFTYSKKEEWINQFQPDIHSGVEDASIIATYVMLKAAELNLDTCWVNYFPNDKLEKSLDIDGNEKSVLLLLLGYSDAKPLPNHFAKKELKDLVKYI